MSQSSNGPAEDDDDGVRGRFANIEKEADSVVHGDLPEVPKIKFERPGAKTATEKPKSTSSGLPPLAGGIIGGDNVRGAGQAYTVGTTLVVSIVGGAGLGWLFDTYVLHKPQTPWGLIVGFLLGTVSGFISLVRVANRINQEDGSGGGK